VFLGLDVLDGFLARKFNCESVFGKNFDLVVDGFIGFLFSFVLVVIGIIDLLFVYLVIPAIVLLFVALVLGFKKMKKKTFAPAKWRKINGAVFFVIPLLFVLGIGWVSYLLLIYVYVSRIVHLRELLV
jgi:phosphatidylglycerophosphate synthase